MFCHNKNKPEIISCATAKWNGSLFSRFLAVCCTRFSPAAFTYERHQLLKQLRPSRCKWKPAAQLNCNRVAYPGGRNGAGDTSLWNASSVFMGLRFVISDLSVTTCGPEFSFLMLSEQYYFFLSGGIKRHTIDDESAAETDIDVGGQKKILERQMWGSFIRSNCEKPILDFFFSLIA